MIVAAASLAVGCNAENRAAEADAEQKTINGGY